MARQHLPLLSWHNEILQPALITALLDQRGVRLSPGNDEATTLLMANVQPIAAEVGGKARPVGDQLAQFNLGGMVQVGAQDGGQRAAQPEVFHHHHAAARHRAGGFHPVWIEAVYTVPVASSLAALSARLAVSWRIMSASSSAALTQWSTAPNLRRRYSRRASLSATDMFTSTA